MTRVSGCMHALFESRCSWNEWPLIQALLMCIILRQREAHYVGIHLLLICWLWNPASAVWPCLRLAYETMQRHLLKYFPANELHCNPHLTCRE